MQKKIIKKTHKYNQKKTFGMAKLPLIKEVPRIKLVSCLDLDLGGGGR